MRLRVLALAVLVMAGLSVGGVGAVSMAQAQSVPDGGNIAAPGMATPSGVTLDGPTARLFDPALPPSLPNYEYNLPPTWTITSPVAGATIILNDGSGHYGYFSPLGVGGTWTLNLVNSLSLTGGHVGSYASGGAMSISGNLTLSASGAVNLSGNSATSTVTSGGFGGAMDIGGNLNLAASGGISLSGNSATNTAPGGKAMGGAIYAMGEMSLSAASGNITLSGNSATASLAQGGAIYNTGGNTTLSAPSGAITLSGNSITGNGQWVEGGAIWTRYSNNAVPTTADVSLSAANGITLSGNSVTGSGTLGIDGGAITNRGNVSLSTTSGDIILSGNSVTATGNDAYGGAIYTWGNVDLSAASGAINISENSVTGTTGYGGAIYVEPAATNEAGIPAPPGNLTITSGAGGTTIYNNTATTQGGALWMKGNLTLDATNGNITFSGNKAGGMANAAYLNNSAGPATASFIAGAGQTITFFDPIASNAANGLITVSKTGPGTLSFDGSLYGDAANRTSAVYGATTVSAGTFSVVNNAVYGVMAGDPGAPAGSATSFTLAPGATLAVSPGSSVRADTASLNGDVQLAITSASQIPSTSVTLIYTSGGITGTPTFSVGSGGVPLGAVDYMTFSGGIIGNNYVVNTALSWNAAPNLAHGTFTLTNAGDAFNVDVPLVDKVGPFASGWDGKTLTKAGLGTLTLSAANSYTGQTLVNAGTLQANADNALGQTVNLAVASGAIFNSGNGFNNSIGALNTVDGANVTFGPSSTVTIKDTLRPAGDTNGGTVAGNTLFGTGTLIVDPSILTMTGSQPGFVGTLGIVGGSQLVLGVPGTSPVDIVLGGTLQNAGTVSFANSAVGNTLTMHSLIGQGGTFVLHSVLGADNSATDKLIINGGTATGQSYLQIINQGGLGALTVGNGINVVQVQNGGTTGTTAFSLTGGSIAAGAYVYTLQRSGLGGSNPDDWYLRSTVGGGGGGGGNQGGGGGQGGGQAMPELSLPNYRLEVPVYMAAPALAERMGRTMLGTYHDRRGEDYLSDKPGQDMAGWIRVFGETGRTSFDKGSSNFGSQGPSYDFGIDGLQFGFDALRMTTDSGLSHVAGIYGGYMHGHADVNAVYYGSKAGTVDMDAYSLGAYYTLTGNPGWYVDAVLQSTWYSNALAQSQIGAKIHPNGFGLIASLEGGYPIQLGNGFAIEPQAQLIYQYNRIDNDSDYAGRVKYDDVSNWIGRLGLRATKNWTSESGKKGTVWARINVWQQMGNDAKTTFTNINGLYPTGLSTSLGGTWGQIGVGVSGQLTEKLSGFITGDYNQGLGNNRGHSFSGRVGLKYEF